MNQLGRELAEEGKLDEALAVLSLIARGNPRSARAHELLGDVYLRKAQTPKAIESYERALALRPGNAALA